jgi:hypothetical protein
MIMRQKMWITMVLVVLLLVVSVAAVQAQSNGAIRGTIYNDTNVDGVCGVGDPTISGVPVSFTHEGGHTITLTSGTDGTYGLAGVSVGVWNVAAQPLQGWTTTSASPIAVTLTAENNAAGGINFCLAQVEATQPIAPTPTPAPPATLPESGGESPSMLMVAVVAGALLLMVGTALIIRERRATS